MSLVSILRKYPEIKNIIPDMKDLMTNLDGKIMTQVDWKAPIIVPHVGLSSETGFMGTAVDYLIRAILIQHVGRQKAKQGKYVAEKGLYFLSDAMARASLNQEETEDRIQGFIRSIDFQWEIEAFLSDKLSEAMKIMDDFVDGKKSLNDAASAALYMARFEHIYEIKGFEYLLDEYFRAKEGRVYFPHQETTPISTLIENVAQMGNLFSQQIVSIPMERVLCNPTFGEYSEAVGGAKADFIFDHTLIDIKSTIHLEYSKEMMAQILGYAVLANADNTPIDRVGIYFARYGVWAMLPLSSIPQSEKFVKKYLYTLIKTSNLSYITSQEKEDKKEKTGSNEEQLEDKIIEEVLERNRRRRKEIEERNKEALKKIHEMSKKEDIKRKKKENEKRLKKNAKRNKQNGKRKQKKK